MAIKREGDISRTQTRGSHNTGTWKQSGVLGGGRGRAGGRRGRGWILEGRAIDQRVYKNAAVRPVTSLAKFKN